MSDIEIDHGNRFLTAENDGADMGVVTFDLNLI
jgi:hypothetical protein